MRRSDKKMEAKEAFQVLEEGMYGTLSTIGADGYPYGVPLNYAVVDDCIYFHTATQGKKLDHIQYDDRVSFSVVTEVEVVPELFSTHYACVICFGRAAVVEDPDEKQRALEALVHKYMPHLLKEGKEKIDKEFNMTGVVKVKIEHITGKKSQ